MATNTDEKLKYLTENYVGKLCTLTGEVAAYLKDCEPDWKSESSIKRGTTVLVVKFLRSGSFVGDDSNVYFNVWVLDDTKVLNIFGLSYKTIVSTESWALFKWL